MNKIIFAISLILISGVCNAAEWSSALTVEKVFTEGKSDIVVVYTSGQNGSTNGCSLNNWIFTADTEARRNRAYSTLMSALLSGKKILLWRTDSCANWSYHEATSVMLLK